MAASEPLSPGKRRQRNNRPAWPARSFRGVHGRTDVMTVVDEADFWVGRRSGKSRAMAEAAVKPAKRGG
jgi:hypothetical protein